MADLYGNTYSFPYLDLTTNPNETYTYNLTLCAMNRSPICALGNAMDIIYTANFAEPDELTFSIPRKIQDSTTKATIDNPEYNLVRGYCLVLMETNLVAKYFLIDLPKNSGGSGVADIKSIHCYSLEYQLNNQYLRLFNGTRMIYNPRLFYSFDQTLWTKYNFNETTFSINATGKTHIYIKTMDFDNITPILVDEAIAIGNSIINGIGINIATGNIITIGRTGETGDGILNILEDESNWTIGSIDSSIYIDSNSTHKKYRQFEISNKSWTSILKDDVEASFTDDFGNCKMVFDTKNKIINVKSLQNLNVDSGLYLCPDNYLTKIEKQLNFNTVYTKLHVYGSSISINTVNPLGTDYILDYSYFINNSYFSSSLLTAWNNYQTLVTSNMNTFKNLLTTLNQQGADLNVLTEQVSTLNNDMQILLTNKDLAIQQGVDLSSINAQIASKQTQVNSQQTLINNKNSDINTTNSQISALQVQLDMNNGTNFTQEQLNELQEYTMEKTWENTNYSDPQSLYDAAIQAFIDINNPEININSIEIIDLLNCSKTKVEASRLKLGQMATIYYEGIGEFSLVIQSYVHTSNGGLQVTLTNRTKKTDSTQHLSDSLGSLYSTSSTVNANKNIWDYSQMNHDFVNGIIANGLDSAKYQIQAGSNQGIKIDNHGIALTDVADPNNKLAIINNCIAMTQNNWATASLAILPSGIIAQNLIGKILAGTKLYISNDSGDFRFDQNGALINCNKFTLQVGTSQATFGSMLEVTDGLIKIKAANVDISGLVTFSSLSNGLQQCFSGSDGNTTINGSYIKTGTIDANLANITNINASNINTGTINGRPITFGTSSYGTVSLNSNGLSNGYGQYTSLVDSDVFTWNQTTGLSQSQTVALPSRYQGKTIKKVVILNDPSVTVSSINNSAPSFTALGSDFYVVSNGTRFTYLVIA